MKYKKRWIKEKLLENVERKNGCWEWQGTKNDRGYGLIYDGESIQRCPRVAYQVFVGPVPKRLLILHSCDNPSCINPKHLKAGTSSENRRQAVERNRLKIKPFFRDPLRHSHVKVTWRQVNLIRKSYKTGLWT